MTPQALAEKARLYPLRDAYQFNELGQMEASWGNTAAPNPPYGALLTYSIGQGAGDQKFALTISDTDGEANHAEARSTAPARRRRRGCTGSPWDLPPGYYPESAPSPLESGLTGRGGAGFGGGFGRGGGGQQVALGRYTATIGTIIGDAITPIGPAESFLVIALPK